MISQDTTTKTPTQAARTTLHKENGPCKKWNDVTTRKKERLLKGKTCKDKPAKKTAGDKTERKIKAMA